METTELTETQKLYVERPIEEEHLTFEEFEKVLSLRNAYKPKKSMIHTATKRGWEVGDKVWVYVKRTVGERVGGIVEKVHKDGTVDVTSAIKHFKNVKNVSRRNVEDLSHIEVPEELKRVSTSRLLNAFKASGVYRWWYNHNDEEYENNSGFESHTNVFINGKKYDSDVVKAELNTREHIYSKQDKELVKQLAD